MREPIAARCLAVTKLEQAGRQARIAVKLGGLAPGRTVLNAGEVVTSITLPPPPAGMVGVYKKLGRNQISDLSIVGVAVLGYPSTKSPSGYAFRIALAPAITFNSSVSS